jgi:26S proteasome regulatory subunit N13
MICVFIWSQSVADIWLSPVELIHFCWRPRSAPSSRPTLDLVMVPADAHFNPYVKSTNPSSSTSPPINGRIYVLKFSSSSQRHFFWLQSKSQSSRGEASYWSARDKRLGEIVDELLQGEDVDVPSAIAQVQDQDPDDDEPMEDVERSGHPGGHHQGGSGGAGPGATGGDIREEGEEAREGGADGARA